MVSKLERKIIDILNKEGINFQKEYRITDLRKGLMRYDFYLPDYNCFIEVNGEQHYTYSSIFYKNRSEFLKAQERDRHKIGYALSKSIPLYIFPCFDMPTNFQDFFLNKYRAKSKYHNDAVFYRKTRGVYNK